VNARWAANTHRPHSLRSFYERQAPPILIWRYLVEKKGINPADIAVYCDLKFNRKDNPPPPDFVHFSGGEEDFGAFRAGNYHHIIFNQSLQEGWDDPECCFAYIDKSMESKTQVEQVIGRVLRQPGARHYQDPDLNTANFYIRIGAKQEFPQILETVRKKIAADYPEVKLEGYADRKERERLRKEPKLTLTVPQIHIDLEEAITFSGSKPGGPFIEAVQQIPDYRVDTVNTVGKGERMRAVQTIGDSLKAAIETAELSHSNRVMARWIVRRMVQSLYPPTVMSVDWSDPRFDARVELTSVAAHTLRQAAENLVSVYLEHAQLAFEEENLYTVGPAVVNPKKYITFTNATHEGYSDLKPLEELFARAIDDTGLRWVRNPSNGGYSIPLLQTGDTRRFFSIVRVNRLAAVCRGHGGEGREHARLRMG
jgi:type III restriction enzyme